MFQYVYNTFKQYSIKSTLDKNEIEASKLIYKKSKHLRYKKLRILNGKKLILK